MIRANGFALFRGPESVRLAEAGTARVQRFGDRRVIMARHRDARFPGDSVIVALATDGGADLPVVHGFVNESDEDGEPLEGEFAFLAAQRDGYVAGRDALGTRPLYVDGEASIVASDHRFFPAGDPPRLVPRGATMAVELRATRITRRVKPEKPVSLEESATRLAEALEDSVERRVKGVSRAAVSFSGGLDSSIIAMLASRWTEVVLCSAHAESSRDNLVASRAADLLGLRYVSETLERDKVVDLLRGLDLPFAPSEMDRALWSLYSTTALMASREGAQLLLLGQLADELFGGYMKYALAAARDSALAQSAMEADVEACAERAFPRDELACARYLQPRFPFADERVVALALGLPLHYKVFGQQRKVVLRMAAERLGLPSALAQAPKKAAQYSSGIAKLIP